MNRKNLRQRKGGSWAVVYYVPEELKGPLAKKLGRDAKGTFEIVRGLGTRDEKEAMRRKTAKLLEIQAEVHRLIYGDREDTFSLMREARGYAQARRDLDPQGLDIDALDLQVGGRPVIDHGTLFR